MDPNKGGWKKEMAIYNLKARFIKATVIAILITTINQTNSYGAGRTAGSIANTILSGEGVPAKSLGINGDFYIDSKSMNMYGPKKNNSWPLPISMRGPAGPVGPTGVDGKNGVSATSGTGATGPAGPQGATGPAGPQGATGPAGAAGSGSGSTGPQGPAGATGATGAQGPKGDTGTAGASNIYFGSVTFSNLINGTVGSSTVSSQFGNFLAGKAYTVDVLIYATNSDIPPYSLKVSFAANAGSPVITTKYINKDNLKTVATSNARGYTNDDIQREFSNTPSQAGKNQLNFTNTTNLKILGDVVRDDNISIDNYIKDNIIIQNISPNFSILVYNPVSMNYSEVLGSTKDRLNIAIQSSVGKDINLSREDGTHIKIKDYRFL